jgi:hypothetical protein
MPVVDESFSRRGRANLPQQAEPSSVARTVCNLQLCASVAPSNAQHDVGGPDVNRKQHRESVPQHFTSDETLERVTGAHEQRPVRVDSGGHAGVLAGEVVPSHVGAMTARGTSSPGVENSIEPAGHQIVVPQRQRDQRFSTDQSPVNWASELAFD